MDTFSTKSKDIEDIVNSLYLTKTLFVSSLIVGEDNIGKKSLAKHILPDAKIISAKEKDKLVQALTINSEIIIIDFEYITNINHIDLANKRVIATSKYISNQQDIQNSFSFIYNMPSLIDRPQDVELLKDKFLNEACLSLDIDCKNVDITSIENDLSNNSKSLKRSVNSYLFKKNTNSKDIEELIYNYIYETLEGTQGYKENISLFERPLIQAGLKKYKSKLKLAEVLGLTRNTLRKKIHEHNIH